MKKVLITGAGGFIARHTLSLLAAQGYNVHAVDLCNSTPPSPAVHWHVANLLDGEQLTHLLEGIRPTHLLHFAWYTEPGQFWNSSLNLRWVGASLHLIEEFKRYGGKRIVGAGTCAEYNWSEGICQEDRTPLQPLTVYGACKDAVRGLLKTFAKYSSLSWAWGRIFWLFGPYEHPTRLVADVVKALFENRPANCTQGEQKRDFLYVEDVAAAFVALLNSEVQGPVNIGMGKAIAVKDLVHQIAVLMGAEHLLRLGAVIGFPDESPLIQADTRRLSEEVGWRPRYSLEEGLQKTIDWWKQQGRDRVTATGMK